MLLTTLQLRPGAELPLYRQLIKLIKEEIQKGGLSAGTKLPSIRVLAQALGVFKIKSNFWERIFLVIINKYFINYKKIYRLSCISVFFSITIFLLFYL